MNRAGAPVVAVLAAAGFALATRPGGWGAVAWPSAVLLHLALARVRRRRAAACVTALVALGPASVATTPIAPLHPAAGLLALAVIAIGFAPVGALALVPAGREGEPGPWPVWARTATAWVATEAAWGAPWLLGDYALPVMAVGSALADGPMRHLASLVGAPGLSLVLLLGSGAMVALARRSDPVPRGAAAAALLASCMASVPAWVDDAAPGEALPALHPPGLRMRLVQHGPTPPSVAAARFDPGVRAALMAPLFASLEGHDGRLVIWPEAAWPEPLASLRTVPFEHDAALLFGAATVRNGATYNSVLLQAAGQLVQVADKARPVPFTEGAVVAGRLGSTGRWNDRVVAAAVCWDAAFPHVARAAARAGAEVLVYLADDSYAVDGPVGRLHLRQARLRALETGLPVVLVQAAGPSAAIGPDGRVRARLGVGAVGHLDVDLPASARWVPARATPDLVGAGAALATLLPLTLRFRTRRWKGGES